MATQPKPTEQPVERELVRPPVPGGTGEVESLGRFIDNLMGDARMSRAVDHEISRWVAEVNSKPSEKPQDSRKPLPDPAPARPPEPVPGGTGQEGRGGRPGESRSVRPDRPMQ